MKVILTENIEALGQIGQIVNVASGYARNFLFPQKLALEATGKNVRELDHKKRILAQKRERVAAVDAFPGRETEPGEACVPAQGG